MKAKDKPAVIFRTNELYLDSKFDEAITAVRELENTHPGNPAVSYFTANGYWWKIFRLYVYDKDARDPEFDKKFDFYLDETIRRSEALLAKNRQDIKALFYLGNAYSLKSRVKGLRGSYFSAGRDAAKGKGYLEQVLKMDPQQHDAFYNIGVYNYLADTLPGYAKVLKAFLFMPGGSKKKGLSLLKTAGEKSSYFGIEARLILARFYADFEEQPFEALKIVQEFHGKHPDNAWFHYWKGTLYSDEINDYGQAQAIYEQVLTKCKQAVPGYTAELRNQAWLKLARCLTRQLYPEKAIEELKALIAEKPKQPSWILPRAYVELGDTLDLIGMRQDALVAYNKVLTLPDYRDSHEQARNHRTQKYNQTAADIFRLNLEGRRLIAAGKFDEAEKALQDVLSKHPNNEQTLYALGELHYARNEHDKAGEVFRDIIRRNPKEPKWLVPGTYVRLGQVYEAIKQADRARVAYEKALDAKTLASDDRNIAKRALKSIGRNG
jgi:tetratricopeptide (TPR) repeat protein